MGKRKTATLGLSAVATSSCAHRLAKHRGGSLRKMIDMIAASGKESAQAVRHNRARFHDEVYPRISKQIENKVTAIIAPLMNTVRL